MTDTTESTPQLLTAAEQEICRKIVAQDTGVAGQRAATLLAINEGVSQAEASEQAGLTAGQVRYLLTTFGKKGLAIFPDDVLSRAQSPVETGDKTESPVEEKASKDEGVTQAPAETEKEKKTKKSKKDKGKKSKKGKGKDKKIKKKKKGKKSKKGKAKKAGKKKSKK